MSIYSAATKSFPPWKIGLDFLFLEVFWSRFKDFYDVIGDLRCLRHGKGLHFYISQLLIVKVAFFLDTLNLLQKCLMLE